MRKRRCGLIIGIGIPSEPANARCHAGHELQAEGENKMITRKRALLVLLATMLISLGAVGIRAIPVSAASAHQVPFSASYSGTAILTSPTSATFSGTGIATHLGASTNEAYSVVTGPDSSCPGGLANDHHETLTAANGDTLSAHQLRRRLPDGSRPVPRNRSLGGDRGNRPFQRRHRARELRRAQ